VTGGHVSVIVRVLAKLRMDDLLHQPADGCAFRVAVTRAGERSLGEMARGLGKWVVALLAALSRREHEELLKLLAKLKASAMEVGS